MRIILSFLFLIISLNVFAVENKSKFWFGTFANNELSQRFSFWIETQLRYGLDEGQTSQFLYRTGLLQKKSDDLAYGYLYGFITANGVNEHRYTFQHALKYNALVSHRARLEYRTFEKIEDSTWRFRYLLRYAQNNKSKMGIVVWDELFLNLQKDDLSGNTFVERNRLFIGLSKKHHNAKMEFGYLNQFVPRDNLDVSEHVLVLYIFI